MEDVLNLSKQETDELVKDMKKVFPIVRILSEDEVNGLHELDKQNNRCYDFWHKSEACKNCISKKALDNDKEYIKLEYLSDKPFQVIAKPLRVEGKRSVMEMLKPLDNFSVNFEEFNLIAEKLFNYSDQRYLDPLTGAYNKVYFEERKNKVYEDMGVAIFDVDNFKYILETYGHTCGELLLRAIVSETKTQLWSNNRLIKIGDDRFIVLIPNVSKLALEQRVEAIQERIRNLIIEPYQNARFSISVGLAKCENQKLIETVIEAKKYLDKAKTIKDTICSKWSDEKIDKIVPLQNTEDEKTNKLLSIILSFVVGYRNNESAAHILHVEQITELMINKLEKINPNYKFTNEEKKDIVIAAGLHDIGKLCIDDDILNKPGKLTPEEFDEMKKHTTFGGQMMDSLTLYQDEPLIKMVHDVCLEHHERFDGKGYPLGKMGDEIHIWSQVVGIADVYDALVSNRVYKDAYAHDKAVEMILNNECGVFNPMLLDLFIEIKEDIRNLYI